MTDEQQKQQEDKKEHQKEHHFFVDGKRFATEKASLTGADIKAIAQISANYQLFEEEEGDKPDRAISDGESIYLGGEKVFHFFAVPPATFGIKNNDHL
jgi:hypothetical protein